MPLELDISVEWLIYAQFFIHPNNQFMCAIENSHDNEQKVKKNQNNRNVAKSLGKNISLVFAHCAFFAIFSLIGDFFVS